MDAERAGSSSEVKTAVVTLVMPSQGTVQLCLEYFKLLRSLARI